MYIITLNMVFIDKFRLVIKYNMFNIGQYGVTPKFGENSMLSTLVEYVYK